MYWGSVPTYITLSGEARQRKHLTITKIRKDYRRDVVFATREQDGNASDKITGSESAFYGRRVDDKNQQEILSTIWSAWHEYNVYANGTYVGDHPLVRSRTLRNNPFHINLVARKRKAGHGNTFQDIMETTGTTGTPWIAVNWNFEGRLAMFPAGFDELDQMYANTRSAMPHIFLQKKWTTSDELFTGWMLLSYKKPVYRFIDEDGPRR